ncbi:cation:proton antiporter [Gryllotalpicola ginsengisoli]|uniref:cation:proton antiporter n=1 Tax=Gryllotalpicola ginsengisoli TaxID=444608 RepID=UPI000688978E|nr:cation:proton antiporter [Gryllotalpicola ginsengisoli]
MHVAAVLAAASEQPSIGDDLIVLGVLFVLAYVLGRFARLIGLPAIPIYMIVGLLASPHTEIFPLDFQAADVELVAVFGLILLLFNLGLEFDQDEFIGNAGKLLISGGSYIVLNTGLGWLFGALVGWGPREALIIAGMVGTCSSAIITKLLIELRRLANPETPAILGVTVFGDIFVAVYLAIVSVVLSGKSDFWSVVLQLGIAAAFLVAMFLIAQFGSRPVEWLLRVRDDELFTLLFFGLALLFAGIGELTGVTDAIGAFLIGLLFGTTRHAAKIERIAEPLRDVFAAFFFLNFGLALNVHAFPQVFGEVVIAVVGTVVVSYASGLLIAYFNRMGHAAGVNIAVIFVSRGEFTLILATLAAAAGLNEKLTPFAGLYVLIMAVVGPLLASNSDRINAWLARMRARRRPQTADSQLAEEERESNRKRHTVLDPLVDEAMLETETDARKRTEDF